MICVASSWRNTIYPTALRALRLEGLLCYGFRAPEAGNEGFHWTDIDPDWEHWTPQEYRDALLHPVANIEFDLDMCALQACDELVLIPPCGRSAHLELGYAIGAGKPAYIYIPSADGFEPELMYKAATAICLTWDELLAQLRAHYPKA